MVMVRSHFVPGLENYTDRYSIPAHIILFMRKPNHCIGKLKFHLIFTYGRYSISLLLHLLAVTGCICCMLNFSLIIFQFGVKTYEFYCSKLTVFSCKIYHLGLQLSQLFDSQILGILDKKKSVILNV